MIGETMQRQVDTLGNEDYRVPTCCLKSIFSRGDLWKLDKNDKGKTKAALPSKTSPSRIALTSIEVFGLKNGT